MSCVCDILVRQHSKIEKRVSHHTQMLSQYACKIVESNIKPKYEGKSISNQPIPFPIDRDTQDFHALFQYML